MIVNLGGFHNDGMAITKLSLVGHSLFLDHLRIYLFRLFISAWNFTKSHGQASCHQFVSFAILGASEILRHHSMARLSLRTRYECLVSSLISILFNMPRNIICFKDRNLSIYRRTLPLKAALCVDVRFLIQEYFHNLWIAALRDGLKSITVVAILCIDVCPLTEYTNNK